MRLDRSFYARDVLLVAPDLIGKILVRDPTERPESFIITEVEAYRGTEDAASHARFGKTSRNQVMFADGGLIYVYLIYGVHWMLNILIRGLKGIDGPGKVTRAIGIDKSFYGENLTDSKRIWVEDNRLKPGVIQKPRYGIDYAGEPWRSMPWRYIMAPPPRIS
jgi:DNA-3-methyladenine glycosylase